MKGNNYYRLKQIDEDGNAKYSGVVMVNVNEMKPSSISIYPNPTTNSINIAFSQPSVDRLQILLSEISGRLMLLKSIGGNNRLIRVNLPMLAKGIYVISIVNSKGEKLLTDKLIIQ
jgi:hypothetical protein